MTNIPSIFSRHVEAILIEFTISETFFAKLTVLKIGQYNSDIPKDLAVNVKSLDAFRPIAHERKYLMDYK